MSITVFDQPSLYIGLPKGSDQVLLVVNPGTDQEIRIQLDALTALDLAVKAEHFGEKLLAQHQDAIARHKRNTESVVTVAREQPIKLDS